MTFHLVFTVEGDSELPDFEPKVNEKDNISILNIKPEKVLNQFKNLNVSKSCSPDNCHPFFLRECAEEIYLPLSRIFRDPLSTGDVPNDWKKANTTYIFKKGNKQEPGNYRPVSLTSVLCKLLESNIKEEIMNHLSRHNLLSDSRFGCRKNRSTIYNFLL